MLRYAWQRIVVLSGERAGEGIADAMGSGDERAVVRACLLGVLPTDERGRVVCAVQIVAAKHRFQDHPKWTVNGRGSQIAGFAAWWRRHGSRLGGVSMNDFAIALAESFAVTPSRTTGLVIDTFDNSSDSTTSVMACICRPDSAVRASVCVTSENPVLGSVSPCCGVEHEPALASICRVASTVA